MFWRPLSVKRLHPAGRRGLLHSVPQDVRLLHMPHRGTNYFHLHLVSDATGETLITVARAAAAQYTAVAPVEHMHPLVRSSKHLDRVLNEIEAAPGIVLYTLLEPGLAERLEKTCRELGLPCLSILGPVLGLFQAYLGGETKPRIGAQHVLNADYFKRIDALNYTMLHDADQYIDRQAVAAEIAAARKLCGKHNWPIIDVTRRSIEETAAEVMALLADRRRLS